jgi:hypothetical protein
VSTFRIRRASGQTSRRTSNTTTKPTGPALIVLSQAPPELLEATNIVCRCPMKLRIGSLRCLSTCRP